MVVSESLSPPLSSNEFQAVTTFVGQLHHQYPCLKSILGV